MSITQLFELFSLKKGITKIHMALLAVLILLASLVFSGSGIALFKENGSRDLTQAVLNALEMQNRDKALEYDESKPIIQNLEKYLYAYENSLYKNRTRALGYLTVIKQRFKYLRYKDLETSEAEKLVVEAGDKANLSKKE